QSRRIDRQLRGRSARLGDPGSSKFYVSFEDSLMRLFTSPRITAFLQRFRPPEGEPISAKVLNKSIETAQKRVEQRNYMMRKHTLEYDDVMNKQRAEIYAFRNEVLHAENTVAIGEELLGSVCGEMCERFFQNKSNPNGWNPEGFREWLITNFPITFEREEFDNDYMRLEDIELKAKEKIVSAFLNKLAHDSEKLAQAQIILSPQTAAMSPDEILKEVVRNILIRNIDQFWQEHLLHIDHLRTEVSLRAIGQKDPLTEFKHEAFSLFESLSFKIKLEIAHALFKFSMVIPTASPDQESRGPKLRRAPHRTDLSLLE
ncbi:MAG: preprotein translocase subunit SecA, partial [Chlamydiales bacterium]